MEEIKTELNPARTHSERLREEVHLMRTSLEKEQQKHKKTCKELEELKSLHETLMAKGEEDKKKYAAEGSRARNHDQPTGGGTVNRTKRQTCLHRGNSTVEKNVRSNGRGVT